MKKLELRQIIKEEISKVLTEGEISLSRPVYVFIIINSKQEILTKNGSFKLKPVPTDMEIFNDIMHLSQKFKELEKKGITDAYGYELNNKYDKSSR